MYFKNAKPTTVETVSQSSCLARQISSAMSDENFPHTIPEHNLFRAASVSQVGIAHPLQYLDWCAKILYWDSVLAYAFIGASWSTYARKEILC